MSEIDEEKISQKGSVNKRLLVRAGLTAAVSLLLGASLPLHWPNLIPILLFGILGLATMTMAVYSLAKSQYHKGRAEVHGENVDRLRQIESESADGLKQIEEVLTKINIEKTRGWN